MTKTIEAAGYVQLDSEDVLDLCRRNYVLLKDRLAEAHEANIQRIYDRGQDRGRYFWRPWLKRPPLTRLQAEQRYASRRDWGDGFYTHSDRETTEANFRRARDRVRKMEQAAHAAPKVLVSISELDWLKEGLDW